MASPKDIEKAMMEDAKRFVEHTRERYTGSAAQVYERLKPALPGKLSSWGWHTGARFEDVDFNDELRLCLITIAVKRGSLVCRATVSDAGIVDGSPAADVDIEFIQFAESKWRKPDMYSLVGAMEGLKAVVWGDYLNG